MLISHVKAKNFDTYIQNTKYIHLKYMKLHLKKYISIIKYHRMEIASWLIFVVSIE